MDTNDDNDDLIMIVKQGDSVVYSENIRDLRKLSIYSRKTPPNFAETVKLWQRGVIDFTEALKRTGLKQATFYRRLKEYREDKNNFVRNT